MPMKRDEFVGFIDVFFCGIQRMTSPFSNDAEVFDVDRFRFVPYFSTFLIVFSHFFKDDFLRPGHLIFCDIAVAGMLWI